jgi:hypothetical protein
MIPEPVIITQFQADDALACTVIYAVNPFEGFSCVHFHGFLEPRPHHSKRHRFRSFILAGVNYRNASPPPPLPPGPRK